MNQIDIFINEIPFKVKSNISIIEGCNQNGFEISRFCFHEKLFVAGNCRMCLVEIKNQAKLVASCGVFFTKNMSVFTNSSIVKKSKENILEFLLINHPLDCPICDQGGECDLQNLSYSSGSDFGRFFENRRAVNNKNGGPLIKTVMNRCIHCMRCIRFFNDIIGFSNIGSVGRGNQIEISFYIKKLFLSDLSGNVIDICPVGALTNKQSSFLSRPWEIKSVKSIDLFDSFGSNIRIDSRNFEILRILPYKNELINENWISDKIRFGFDTLKRQRLNKVLFKNFEKFFQFSWQNIYLFLVNKILFINQKKIFFNVLVGPFCDLKSVFWVKNLLKISKKKNHLINFENFCFTELDFNHFFCFSSKFVIFNSLKIKGCFLFGFNPKKEVPILNLKLRKRFLKGNFFLINFGSRLSLMVPVTNIGLNNFNFRKIVSGNHFFCRILSKKVRKVLIVGNSFFTTSIEKSNRFFISFFLKNSQVINSIFFGFVSISNRASDIVLHNFGLKTKFLEKYSTKPSFLFVIGDSVFQKTSRDSFISFQGLQGNCLISKVNIILPTISFTEKNSLFINSEGRFQNSQKSVSSPKNSRTDFEILFSILGIFTKGLSKKIAVNFLLNQNKVPFFKKNVKPFFSFIHLSPYLMKIKIINKNTVSSYEKNNYQDNLLLKSSISMGKSKKLVLKKSPFSF
jgi:NADH-quinone oxidoreductase chain G